MRSANCQHVTAKLRLQLQMTQHAMADLVGVSVHTIKSVELTRIPLSPQLAQKIAAATGVRLEWLLRNDLDTPPQSSYTANYTADFFRAWRSRRSVPLDAELRAYVPVFLLEKYVSLRGAAEAAATKSEHDVELLMYEFEEFVAAARKKYGSVPGYDNETVSHSVTPNQILIAKQDTRAAEEQLETETKLFGKPKQQSAPD